MSSTASAIDPPISSSSGPVFTGRGAEYFRLWAVNLLFTLLTLGVYSAWAKVRKARYFRQNTRLDGHVFDFHGRPVAIFRGRLIALVLFGAYSWAFNFLSTQPLYDFFVRMQAQGSRSGVADIPDFLSTHPSTEERLKRLCAGDSH